MDWIQQWQSKLNKQNGVAPLVRTGGSRHTGLAALPYRNIHSLANIISFAMEHDIFINILPILISLFILGVSYCFSIRGYKKRK